MENEARYILAGSLIVAVSLLMLAGLVWLAGGSQIAYAHYTIYFRNQSMDGLDINSPVKLRGIKVGEVSNYAFAPGGHNAVRVDIKINPATPIHISSHAVVQRNIVTGLAAIEIDTPPGNSPLLIPGATPPWPIISEGSSDLEKVTTNLTQISQKTAQMLDGINQMLSPANLSALSTSLKNLATVSSALAANQQDMLQTLSSIHRAADSFDQTSDSLYATSEHFNQRFAGLADQTQTALQHTDLVLDSVNRQALLLSGQLQILLATSHQDMNQITNDLHQGENQLSEATRRLNQPASLIFGNGSDQTAPGE